MMHVLRALGRRAFRIFRVCTLALTSIIDTDTVIMFEEAYKQQPGNEELAVQTFFANVRAGRWKYAQQVCPHSRVLCAPKFCYYYI